MSFDTERIRVREILLEHANDALGRAVDAQSRRIPARDLAAFVEGDEDTVHQLFVGRRSFIAKKLTSRSPSWKCADLAKMLLEAPPTGGFMPCVFVVWLDEDTADASVLMLRNEGLS